MEKKKILLFVDWYEPGYKAGGPIRSCVNFTRYMRRDYRVYVFTTDRDLGSDSSYEGIRTDAWVSPEEGVEIFYCSPQQLSGRQIRAQIARIAPDYIYLNSMFSKYFTLVPLLAGWGRPPRYKIILSPRGMLKDSALQFKPAKKKIYLHLFHWMRFDRLIHFLAADATERTDIRRHFGKETRVEEIPNLPGALPDYPGAAEKKSGELSMIFVGRLHPIKNLDYLLKILRSIPVTLSLSIIGSIEDKLYWQQCQEIIKALPANITVQYLGEMANHQLPAIISRHHIFALPTRGENFGHAIFEALSLGKPVLVSDQTPWRNLEEAGAGWDVSLDEPAAFERSILQAAGWGQETYSIWSRAAFDLARKHIDNTNALEKYRKLFS